MTNLPEGALRRLPDRDLSASTLGALRAPLLWALVASSVMHAALVAMPLAYPGNDGNAMADRGVVLQATLAPLSRQKPDQQAEYSAHVAVTSAPSPLQFSAVEKPAPPELLPLPTVAADVHSAYTSPPLAGIGKAADLSVDAQPILNSVRLGDLLSRQQGEFPMEVEAPSRPIGKISARYPRAALADGREGTVAVWVVVNEHGAADEIVIVEGTEEFAGAVVQAIRNSHFMPARNNLTPIRYPIALEFRFAIRAQAGGVSVAR